MRDFQPTNRTLVIIIRIYLEYIPYMYLYKEKLNKNSITGFKLKHFYRQTHILKALFYCPGQSERMKLSLFTHRSIFITSIATCISYFNVVCC